MKIGIAGAGAGKTTSMAKTIIELYDSTDKYLKIFCITFTNNASKCIESKLKDYFGRIPSNIVVSTIHSFLYRELITPYYYLLYGKCYERISIGKLPSKSNFKNATIRKLEDRNLLHQTKIPERAKWILVQKSSDRKPIKDKRKIIYETLKKYIGAICIDEAQDIDDEMMSIINVFESLGINMILMGDPKQDLKGHNCLRSLMENYPCSLEYYRQCYRCPKEHLDISNLIVNDEEKQYSDKTDGKINVFFSSDILCSQLIEENEFDLSYISYKQDIFDTHGIDVKVELREGISEEVEVALHKNHPEVTDISISASSYYLAGKLIENYDKFSDKYKAMNETFQNERLDTTSYGRVIGLLPDVDSYSTDNVVYINSIDSIKGMEGYNCLFILTSDLAPYLFGIKSEDNKIKHKLYVALTRSLNELTIYVTEQVEIKYGKDFINKFFE